MDKKLKGNTEQNEENVEKGKYNDSFDEKKYYSGFLVVDKEREKRQEEGQAKMEKLKKKLVGDDVSKFLDKVDSSVFEGMFNSKELKEICKRAINGGMLEIDEKGKIIGVYVEVGGERKPSKLFESFIKAGFSPEQALKFRLQVRTKAFKDWFGDWEKVVKPYNRRTSKQATVRLNEMSGEKFYINSDALKGIILTDTNGHSIFNAMGRTFVLCNVNGNVIPFYQSSKGSSGKIKGNWYPFFGYTGNWLIKGEIDESGKMSYSSEIDKVTELLNKDFKIPTDFNNQGISESTGINVKDLGLNMYSVFDRFGKDMQAQNTTDPNALVFFDKDINALTNANALFVKEITGIKTEGIKQSHASQSFIKPFIDATKSSNISKVVDENGEPLVVYHGSTKMFKNFDVDKIGSTTGDKSGFYFTNDRGIAKSYYSRETGKTLDNLKLMLGILKGHKSTVYDCFLKIPNMCEYDFKGSRDTIGRQKIIYDARKNGYDGIILKNIVDGSSVVQQVYVVFDPSQIKMCEELGNI